VKQLAFTHEDARIQAIVRMQAADALARMRVASAVKPVAALVSEQDATVRQGYVYTLVRLGGREALPPGEAASQGDWYTREVAMEGLAMLGDGRELAVLESWPRPSRRAPLPSASPWAERAAETRRSWGRSGWRPSPATASA
jgi:HEAT repeat protein